jgi:hypothetical protein
VPTQWLEPEAGNTGAGASDIDLPEGEVVVKPSISGGGNRTARYGSGEHEDARTHARDLVASGRAAMIQPYQASVDEVGELGLVFLGGEFSHAVQKDPMIRRGAGPLDSLIENQVVRAAVAAADQIDLGRRAVAAAEDLLGPTTYARVDVVEGTDGGHALLELELLDPVLFFPEHPDAAATYAEVLSARIG